MHFMKVMREREREREREEQQEESGNRTRAEYLVYDIIYRYFLTNENRNSWKMND